MIYLGSHIFTLVDFANWLTLAILGTGTIVLASVIERHGPFIKLACKRFIAPVEE